MMYGILNHMPIKWSSLILDTMLKAKRYPQYPLPYSLLISGFVNIKELTQLGSFVKEQSVQMKSLKALSNS